MSRVVLVNGRRLFRGPEFQVQLQPAYRRQVVVFRVEKEILEEGRGHFVIGAIAGTQAPVNLQDGLFDRGGLVRHQGIPETGADIDPVDEEQVQFLDAPLLQLGDLVFGEHLVALRQDFAALRVQDVMGHHPAHQVGGQPRDGLHPGPFHLLNQHRGQAFALLDQDIAALGIEDVGGRGFVRQQFRKEGLLDGLALQMHPLGLIEEVKQLFRRVPQGFQEDGGGKFAPPVDPHVQDVLGIELEIDPGPPERNQPRRVDDFTAGVNLGPVMINEQAGGAVQLAHHHPLGAIDDEGAVLGHHRQGAEIDLLLFDIPDGLGLGVRTQIMDHQAHPYLHGHFKGHAPLLALVHVVLGISQSVLHELQGAHATEIPDGKDALEDSLEAVIRARLRFHVFLQETMVGLFLHLDEIRNVHHPLDLAEIFAVQP